MWLLDPVCLVPTSVGVLSEGGQGMAAALSSRHWRTISGRDSTVAVPVACSIWMPPPQWTRSTLQV